MIDNQDKIYKIRGWYPLPMSHLSAHVREAIKIGRFRLQFKRCYRNAKKLVLQNRALEKFTMPKIPFTYCEGIVESNGYFFAHGWVRDVDGIHHEVTMKKSPKIIMHNEYDFWDVLENVGNSEIDDLYWDVIEPDLIDRYELAHGLEVFKHW